jgi:DNA-binding NtrC family response regulator
MSSAVVLSEGRRSPPPGDAGSFKNADSSIERRHRTVFVVDDERLIADTLAEILNDSDDFEAVAMYDAASALKQAREHPPDVLITDVVMPGMNGIQLAKEVRSIWAKTRVVLLSGQAQTRDLVAQAKHEGYAFELWAKPIHPDVVLTLLRKNQA